MIAKPRSLLRQLSGLLTELASEPPGLTLCTAGHIDHGKTALVAALTGINTDRLAEEHRRGITIELGFAELQLPSGHRLGLIDVPGHERFVKTMVAGASAVDLFLMVIAADDGVMPQTVEHAQVLRALGVNHGVIALTKMDLPSKRQAATAAEAARDLLPGLPLAKVSSHSGEGLDKLRSALADAASGVASARDADVTWVPEDPLLHVDRSFTAVGAGLVVTGTVASGSFAVGDMIWTYPAKKQLRVRAIEVHGQPRQGVGRGRRAALNLVGAKSAEVPPGSAISGSPQIVQGSYRLDVRLHNEGCHRPTQPSRVLAYHGTRAAPAKIETLVGKLAQLRLKTPVFARARDRVILRSTDPAGGIVGATVLDPRPRRSRRREAPLHLTLLEEGKPEEVIRSALDELPGGLPADPRTWSTETRLAYALPRFSEENWIQAIKNLEADNAVETVRDRVLLGLRVQVSIVKTHTRPVDPAVAERLTRLIASDGTKPRSPRALADVVGLEHTDARGVLESLAARGTLVRATEDVFFSSKTWAHTEQLVLTEMTLRGSISLAELRDLLQTSRKYSQAILECIGRTGKSVRRGDRHFPRSTGSTGAI